MTLSRLPRTLSVLQQGISQGLHPGAQLYVWKEGELLADVGLGQARADVAMTPDTINLWRSAGKPLTAVAIAWLWENGRLDLDDPVARWIPEFAARGKQSITIRHLLTHTAGIRGLKLNGDQDPRAVVREVCDLSVESGWTPGKQAGYHPGSSWYVLAEIVRRLDGRTIDVWVREKLCARLGMDDLWIGLPLNQQETYGSRIGFTFDTSKGLPDLGTGGAAPEQLARVNPAANIRARARDLGLFYRMLLNKGEWDGVRILSPQTVEAITVRHRVGLHDRTFVRIMDWGLGFLINSEHAAQTPMPYGYAPLGSMRCFGHGGAELCNAFCDPDRRLVVAWMCNGAPGDMKHQARNRAIHQALADDLDIAP